MPIHFTPAEFETRRAAACAALTEAGLQGLLVFRQESMYYLTGYDTFGYVHFQCLFLGVGGDLVLLTRAPDRLQARFTSVIEDIRVWEDRDGADPYSMLRDIVCEFGHARGCLGIELEAYGLTAAKGLAVIQAFEGACELRDASQLVSRLRLVKSPSEIAYLRRAAELADLALDAAHETACAGAFEGDILAAMQSVIYRGGGDDPANEQIIGSGTGALMCRYYSGRRHLDARDQLTLEFAGAFRHYHVCLMRTVPIGEPDPRLVSMHAATRDALLAARDALRPGRPIGEIFDTHARVLDAAGHRSHRMNACGYSLGATFAPNWMDWPMFYHGNPVEAAPGMVFFIHIILFDEDRGLAMSLGETQLVTETGCESFSRQSLKLVVC